MAFIGHELVIINNNWVFDLTTFTGYRTFRSKNGELKSYNKALKVYIHKDGTCNYKKYMEEIPVGVMRKMEVIVNKYIEDNFLDND